MGGLSMDLVDGECLVLEDLTRTIFNDEGEAEEVPVYHITTFDERARKECKEEDEPAARRRSKGGRAVLIILAVILVPLMGYACFKSFQEDRMRKSVSYKGQNRKDLYEPLGGYGAETTGVYGDTSGGSYAPPDVYNNH